MAGKFDPARKGNRETSVTLGAGIRRELYLNPIVPFVSFPPPLACLSVGANYRLLSRPNLGDLRGSLRRARS